MKKKIGLILTAAASLIMPIFTAHADDTFYQYDGRGNLSAIQSSNGGGTYYQHDANGNITSEYDDKGNVTYYSYDAHGNISRSTHIDAAELMAEPKPTPTFSRPQPIRSAPAPVTITPPPIPQIAPRPQLPSITEITPQHGASSAAEIRIYLHNDGLNNLSEADIEKIRIYLKQKGKSIAEIGSEAAIQLLSR
jgi:YD repeat-containing protein